MFEFRFPEPGTIEIYSSEKLLFRHTRLSPSLFLGRGKETVRMFRGNFDISDRVSERIALLFDGEEFESGKHILRFTHPCLQGEYRLTTTEQDGMLHLEGSCTDNSFNRLWLRLAAQEGEHIVGGGEQFSALDLRGRLWPVWTREQGVGRNKLTEVTRLADALDGSGGDYHTTFFPQPTFLSSRLFFAHLWNYEYAELDFRETGFHEVGLWCSGIHLTLCCRNSFPALLEALTALLGRQLPLPDWSIKGLWLGVQGGTKRAVELEKRCREGGMDISAVWIQDWEGKRVTSFGSRLQWDWRWNHERYPGLDRVIAEDSETAWMGYINPYLVEGGVLFREAQKHGFFVRRLDGSDYLFDFGEYDCGVVDLTDPAAFSWYKEVIKTNLIGMGFRGWMADFGEYLPADAVCRNGSGLENHNRWPMLWAKCNREAVREAGKEGEIVFFMRAGAAGSQNYATLIWAGDQCVDWSEDDGLPSVITAALSLGMSGFGLHTCDAGGYTTLFHLKRDQELLLRWLEFACFTPVMRTHEGNRPESNVQLYDNDEIITAAARLTSMHDALFPYLRDCVHENTRTGMPVMRPLFLEAPEEDIAWSHRLYTYLLGKDLLVAPVVEPGTKSRKLWLPGDGWVCLWSGKVYPAGWTEISAPLGKPPVFYRSCSSYKSLFTSVANRFG
ncbi:MAG: alpha-glucosidase [Oscillospiraceae bacterium]|nr:alpha-glucosidase [Oscillospiraceae bacterium]